jgi:hypothetical protein
MVIFDTSLFVSPWSHDFSQAIPLIKLGKKLFPRCAPGWILSAMEGSLRPCWRWGSRFAYGTTVEICWMVHLFFSTSKKWTDFCTLKTITWNSPTERPVAHFEMEAPCLQVAPDKGWSGGVSRPMDGLSSASMFKPCCLMTSQVVRGLSWVFNSFHLVI